MSNKLVTKKFYKNHKRAVIGFSLHEILIIIVFFSLLSVVAIPAYHATRLKEHRSDAVLALTNASARMEQYFLDSKTYAKNITDLGYSSNPAASIDGYYEISVAPETSDCPIASCYILKASPVDSQKHDGDCNPITLSSSGAKAPLNCW